MIVRYLRIEDVITVVIRDFPSNELDDLALSVAETTELRRAHDKVKQFDFVTNEIQKQGLNIADQKALFAELISRFPADREDLHHLRPDDLIIFNPDFENAVTKIIDGEERLLTADEKETVAMFLKVVPANNPNAAAAHAPRRPDDFATQALIDRKHKREEAATVTASAYMNLCWIPCTTCDVERLFSGCLRVATGSDSGNHGKHYLFTNE